MRQLIRTLSISAVLFWSAPNFAQQLTESAVKAFSTRIEAAIARRDIATILDQIAEHAVISATVDMQGQRQTIRMSKAQYREMLEATFNGVSSYSSKRSNEKISIEGSQAVVTADVSETMVIGNQRLSTKAHERATIEAVNGKLMVTRLVSNQVP